MPNDLNRVPVCALNGVELISLTARCYSLCIDNNSVLLVEPHISIRMLSMDIEKHNTLQTI